MLINQIMTIARTEGASGLLARTADRLFQRRSQSYSALQERFRKRIALEIGGPSACFRRRGYFPIYPLLERVDNCNFASKTIWELSIETGQNFQYDADRPPGQQFIAEATDLSGVKTASYDLVLSSHTIEHTANPLKALFEWHRVLTEDGLIVVIAPHRDGTFDHRRSITYLDHLIEDFEHEIDERDSTHLSEILRLHDLTKDPGCSSYEEFEKRSSDNYENRAIHHHVFNTPLVEAMLLFAGFEPLAIEARRPYNIIVVARKAEITRTSSEPLRFAGPFTSDRDMI